MTTPPPIRRDERAATPEAVVWAFRYSPDDHYRDDPKRILRRNPSLMRERDIVAWCCRKWTSASAPEIARAMGLRSHVTVVDSIKRFKSEPLFSLEAFRINNARAALRIGRYHLISDWKPGDAK